MDKANKVRGTVKVSSSMLEVLKDEQHARRKRTGVEPTYEEILWDWRNKPKTGGLLTQTEPTGNNGDPPVEALAGLTAKQKRTVERLIALMRSGGEPLLVSAIAAILESEAVRRALNEEGLVWKNT